MPGKMPLQPGNHKRIKNLIVNLVSNKMKKKRRERRGEEKKKEKDRVTAKKTQVVLQIKIDSITNHQSLYDKM